MKLILFTSLLQVTFAANLRPNVCKHFVDYFTMNPMNCWHNPDVYLDVRDIIRRHGYPLEEYEVETEDHYLIDLFRLPKTDRKGVVLLEAPAMSSCVGWVDKGKRDSLGFLLWDAGYEVWLGGIRGAATSRKHRFLNPDQKPYWNFSFHELGKYDIPAKVDFIVEKDGLGPRELSVVSFSMGSTASLIYASIRPEHSGKWVKVFVLMAPTAMMTTVVGMPSALSTSLTNLKAIGKKFNGEIMTNRSLMRTCATAPMMMVCVVLSLMLGGNAPHEESAPWAPIKYNQNPSGVSFNTLMHYLQFINSKKFQMYDYDEGNMEHYGTKTPPEYRIEDIISPTLLVTAEHDLITTVSDVELFYNKLPERAKIYKPIIVKGLSHASFFYGTHTTELVYLPIIKFLDEIYEKRSNK